MNASPVLQQKLFLRLFGVRFRRNSYKTPFWTIVLVVIALLAARSASAATYTVTDTTDNAADTGSLRYAVNQVNAGTGGDTINFSGVTGTITLGSTLNITESVTINGPGANFLAISGNDTVQVFSVASTAANSVISGLTITHGNATDSSTFNGAGIFTFGTLTVNNCTFSYNKAGFRALNVGAAILSSAGTLTVNGSTFFNNSALVGNGGAIDAVTLVANDSTFYNNSAAAEGGAIWILNGSKLTIQNSTIVGNSAISTTPGNSGGGGIWITFDGPTITNSVISGNTAATSPDYHCTLACTTTPTNTLIGDATVTSLLTALQYNGGPTMTMTPLPGQTGVIGAGLNSTLATDQRGIPRPTAGASDIGAVQSYNLVVSTTADSTNPSSLCDGSNGDTCSLRDALTLANSQGAGDVVTVSGLTGTIALTSPLPDDTADLNINGPGANQLTISGAGTTGSVLNVTNPTAVTNISGVTISGGSAGTNDGGGVESDGTQLTLANCAFTNNSAAGGYGGGLENLNTSGVATVTNCTFSGNTAEIGAAIYNRGTVLVTNSTLSGNTATAHGGGLSSVGSATVVDSTIANNTAGTGGGITRDLRTLTLVNDIVAANTETNGVGNDCALCGTQTEANLISTSAAPIAAAQLMLAPLGYYGPNQTVETMLPLPGSPAIETGDPTQLSAGLTTDERLLPRTINGKLDLGAVETNYTGVQFVQQPSNALVNAIINPAVTVSVTESGTTVANVPVPITFTGTGALGGTLTQPTAAPVTPGGPAVASFGDLHGNTAGTGDTLTATLTITPTGVAPAQMLTATSSPFDILAPPISVPTVAVNPTAPVYGQPVMVTVTVPTIGSVPPTGTVTIFYKGNPIGTGTLGPNGTVIITIPGGTLPAGTDTITAGYGGDGNYSGSTSAAVPVTVTPAPPPVDFSVSSSTGPQTILPGRSATYTVSVASVGGAFNNLVTLSATGLPAGATATFSPASVTPGATSASTKLTIQTAKQSAEIPANSRSTAPLLLGGLLLPLLGVKRGRRKLQRCCLLLLFAALSIGAVTGLTGCSPGGFFGQAPQTYTVTVTGTSGSLQHSTTVILKVQ